MTSEIHSRRLKMNARRRSPIMLLFGILTAGAPASAAARGAAPRRERAAVADTESPRRLGEVSWEEIPGGGDLLEPWFRLTPKPRLEMVWQTGWQYTWLSGRNPRRRYGSDQGSYQFTHDLGLVVRGGDGHLWGGASTIIWQASRRNLYAVKGIRRWCLDPVSDVYAQVAPGFVFAGGESGLDVTRGGLLELELGNRWVAFTTGVHAVGWRTTDPSLWSGPESGTVLTWYFGGRTHGAVGLGVYLGLILVFVATYRGSGMN